MQKERFVKRIVLAYSGGLETSVAIPWLAEKYGAEIITVTMDLGQGKELDDVRDRALASGALARARARPARGVRARVHPAGAAGRRRLRRPLSAGDGARPAAHRQASGAHRADRRRRQRSRTDRRARATTRCAWTCARARSIPASRSSAPRASGDCSKADEVGFARERGIPVPATMEGPVQHRRESVGPIGRRRRAGRSVGRAAREHLSR